MPHLTVTTPLHEPGNKYIEQTHATLCAQTFDSWEWLIVENNGGKAPRSVLADPRVRAIPSDEKNIGALKRLASSTARGQIVVELDADDLLHPEALKLVYEAFMREDADFVYSDCAEFRDVTWDKQWKGYPYGAEFGWKTYPTEHLGHDLIAMSSPPVTPQNIRLVDWAPNHVRAWKKTSYLSVGGHNPAMFVGDDHDLVVRMFLAGKRFCHIPKCLYFYRVHALNTVGTRNQAIRDATWSTFNRTIYALGEKFARDKKLFLVDLCGGIDPTPGYKVLDRSTGHDLDKAWGLASGSVGLIRANDAVEHLKDPVHTMNEAWRVLAPGGFFIIDVPSTSGKGAWCDPTHRSFWNDLSFRYYTEAQYARYVPKFKGRFQAARVMEWFPSDWHKENNVPYAQAHLFALKPGYEPMGHVGWPR